MVKRYTTIFIDDDEEFLYSLARSLPEKITGLCTDFACHFEYASSYDELKDIIGSLQEDMKLALLVSDQLLSGITGLDVIEKIKKDHPDTICVLLTGQEKLDSAIHAMNRQVLDQYVLKRLKEISAVLENFIKNQIEAGIFHDFDPALGARLAMGMFFSLMLPALRGVEPPPTPDQRRRLSEAVVSIMLDGIRTRAGEPG